MILQKINFTPLYKKIEKIFSQKLPISKFNKIKKILIKEIKKLASANFLCYQANMTIIEERKKKRSNIQLISEMELQARTVGEQRVKAKTEINVLLNKIYPIKNAKKIILKNWASDDVVYSVGEMIDRLIIEFIKINDYNYRLQRDKNASTSELKTKISFSEELSRRVEKYLILKLKEIDKKGYYEIIKETRTYDLKGILKPILS